MSRTDPELIAAYRAGDHAALAELVHRYFDRMERYGHRICANREDAEEVLQETFATAIDAMEGFRGEASLKNWLYRIAKSICIKKGRRRREEAGHDETSGHSHAHLPTPTGARNELIPEALLASSELRQCLQRALEKLPPSQRDAVRLVDFEGYTHEEAAGELGLTPEALRTRLYRGRSALRNGAKCQ